MHYRTRHSFLTSFNVNGFIAWESTMDTFTTESFIAACEHVVYPYVGRFSSPRSVVLLDNATIHTTRTRSCEHASPTRTRLCELT